MCVWLLSCIETHIFARLHASIFVEESRHRRSSSALCTDAVLGVGVGDVGRRETECAGA